MTPPKGAQWDRLSGPESRRRFDQVVGGGWAWVRGKRVWLEWSPPPHAPGHRWLVGWGTCPKGCRTMGRLRKCREDDCDKVLFDPDHECPTDAGR